LLSQFDQTSFDQQALPPILSLSSLKSKGAEPYLKRESPKLLARERAIKQAHKWSEEMGGQDSYFPNGGK